MGTIAFDGLVIDCGQSPYTISLQYFPKRHNANVNGFVAKFGTDCLITAIQILHTDMTIENVSLHSVNNHMEANVPQFFRTQYVLATGIIPAAI